MHPTLMDFYRQTLFTKVQGLQKSTVLQQTSVVECWTTLLKQVQHFHKLQHLHMVGFDHWSYRDTSCLDNIKDFKLYLPSSLSPCTHCQFCQPSLLQMEECIWDAEAHDAFEDLQHHLHTWSHANKWKIANITGQIHNTCAREWQAHIDDHVCASVLKYGKAQASLLSLWGYGDWEELQVLDKLDVCALNEQELSMQEKDEIRAVQCHVGIEVDDDELDDEWVPIAAGE